MAPGASWRNSGEICESGFGIDRCPAVFIPFFDPGGEWSGANSNPRDLNSWWADVGTVTDASHDNLTYTGDWQSPYPFVSGYNGTPDQFEQFEWRLDQAYGAGFRRIVLNLPAGVAFGTELHDGTTTYYGGMNQSINQWWAMPAWKRTEFNKTSSRLKTWKAAHSSAHIEIYVGFGLSDNACSLVVTPNSFGGNSPIHTLVSVRTCPTPTNCYYDLVDRWITPASGVNLARDFDPHIQSHVSYVLSALLPWTTTSLQIKMFWMDSASADQPLSNPNSRDRKLYGFTELCHMPAFRNRGVKFGGEAIPIDNAQPLNYSECAVEQGAFRALGQYFDLNEGGSTRFDRWYFNPATTEIHYMPENDTYSDLLHLIDARHHGMIVSALNLDATMSRKIQRLYSMGSIRVADVNCDGQVDVNDWNMWYNQIYLHNLGAGTNPFQSVATGDLKPDGVVDYLDDAMFQNAYAAETGPDHNIIMVDYGDPNCD